MTVGRRYAAALAAGCAKADVPFLDMNGVLADAVEPDDWLFVDRIHLTDHGYDTVAWLLAEKAVVGASACRSEKGIVDEATGK